MSTLLLQYSVQTIPSPTKTLGIAQYGKKKSQETHEHLIHCQLIAHTSVSSVNPLPNTGWGEGGWNGGHLGNDDDNNDDNTDTLKGKLM